MFYLSCHADLINLFSFTSFILKQSVPVSGHQCGACIALSVTKLSLLAVFRSALQLSLFMFYIVAFCNGLQCNGVTGILYNKFAMEYKSITNKIVHIINNVH
jgi:hypothetical protein